MTDEPSPEGTRTPYEATTAEFFALFGSEELTQGKILDRVSGILELAMPAGNTTLAEYRQKLITNWALRGTEGVEAEDGAVMEREKRPEDIAAERQRKIALLCDVSGFLIGSEYSVLDVIQKRDIIVRGLVQLKSLEVDQMEARVRLGNAVAPYVAMTAEKAGINEQSAAYTDMGGMVLHLMEQTELGTARGRRSLGRIVDHPERHVGSPGSRLLEVLRKII